MWAAALNWIVGSRLGRAVSTVLAGLALLFGVYLRGKSEGKAESERRQDEAALEALRNRKKVDEEIDTHAPAERRKRLNRWVQNGDERL